MNILHQKFPCPTSNKTRYLTALGFGVFITIFLLLFKPFQLDTLSFNKQLWVCGVYGFTTSACIILVSFTLPKIFPSFFIEENWTTGKHILFVSADVVFIGIVNYLISPLLVGSSHSLRSFFWFQGITVLVAVLPITIFTLFRQNSLLKKFEQEASVLQKKLEIKLDPNKKLELPASPSEKKSEFPVIELTGDYQGERMLLPPGDLYFIAAANNYVKVYFMKEGKLSYSILRMTMKKAEAALGGWPDFYRCHRAYIVNLDKVQQVEGNAQGYKLQLVHVEESIPVSRNLNDEFSDKLLALRSYVQ